MRPSSASFVAPPESFTVNTDDAPLPRPSFPTRAWRAIKLAFAFLTLIPIPIRDDEATEADLAASRFAYPLVGALIGLILALSSVLLSRVGVGPSLSAFLLLAVWTACSGGLHLDGLADTFDGLFLWGDAERRLAVMRDPQVGSYGVSVLVLVLLGKFAGLVELSGWGMTRAFAVLGAAATSRTLILVSAGLADYARPQGTGRIVIAAATARDAGVASVLTLVIAASLAGAAGLIAGSVALALAWGLTRLARRRLGGVTGDTLGALVELGEATYLVLLGLLQSL